MITKLTKEQAELLSVYRDRGIKRGLSCERFSRDDAEKYARKLQNFLGRRCDFVVVTRGPIEAWYATVLLAHIEKTPSVRDSVRTSVWSSVRDRVLASVGRSVRTSVRDSVRASVRTSVRDSVRDSVWDSVRASVWDSVRASVRTSVRDSVRDSVWDSVWDSDKSFVWPYLDGFFSYYSAWADYYRDVLNLQLPDYSIMSDADGFGLVYPLQTCVVISERPEVIKMSDGRLHCDGGPVVQYRDETRVWALNGVRVPQWLAETPAHEIDCSEYPKIENAEVRREFLRKVGAEQLLVQLGSETLDTMGDYSLEMLDLGGETGRWPYLKMLNPSIGVWHVEPVAKDCKTVQQALNFRNGCEMVPVELT